MLQSEVGEQILHDHGLSHEAIHGVDRDTVTAHTRHDLTATTRRALASCGRRSFTRGCLVAFVTASLVAAYTASYGLAIVAAMVGVGAYAAHRAPEWVFDQPGPKWSVSNTQGDGLTDHEVSLRLAIVAERADYKQELIDERQKEAERRADRERNSVRF